MVTIYCEMLRLITEVLDGIIQRRKERADELAKRRIEEAKLKKQKEAEIIRLRSVTTVIQASGYHIHLLRRSPPLEQFLDKQGGVFLHRGLFY